MTASVRLPIFSQIADGIGRDINVAFYILTILATLLVLAVKAWGIVALVLTCLALVPVIFALLIWITLP